MAGGEKIPCSGRLREHNGTLLMAEGERRFMRRTLAAANPATRRKETRNIRDRMVGGERREERNNIIAELSAGKAGVVRRTHVHGAPRPLVARENTLTACGAVRRSSDFARVVLRGAGEGGSATVSPR